MSDHLPECPVDLTVNYRVDCICSALRACEQRVREEERGRERVMQTYEFGFRKGLSAARDAVAGLPWDNSGAIDPVDALAAIDALRSHHDT